MQYLERAGLRQPMPLGWNVLIENQPPTPPATNYLDEAMSWEGFLYRVRVQRP